MPVRHDPLLFAVPVSSPHLCIMTVLPACTSRTCIQGRQKRIMPEGASNRFMWPYRRALPARPQQALRHNARTRGQRLRAPRPARTGQRHPLHPGRAHRRKRRHRQIYKRRPANPRRADPLCQGKGPREYPDGSLALFLGPRCLARYSSDGAPSEPQTGRPREPLRRHPPKVLWTRGRPLRDRLLPRRTHNKNRAPHQGFAGPFPYPPARSRCLARKASSAALNASGCSILVRCPAPRIRANSEPAMRSCSALPIAGGVNRSCSP